VGFSWASNADDLENRASLQVDLGYSIYQGQYTAGLNLWQGIRYAAPPIGSLRFQKPQPPVQNRSAVMQANSLLHSCLQASNAFLPSVSEDCLFLNVYAPQNANNLPVVVYIHGGGYGAGSGIQNLTDLILANNASFVGVTIQYRLGATGFVSSKEVNSKGTVNAGLKDQTFALQWVQQYISLFGGNPKAVTIFGESAGAGSVMLQALIHNGTNGTSQFNNVCTPFPCKSFS
jgi:carboxylesterase type B